MKKLIISLKTPAQSLKDFATILKKSKKQNNKLIPHYEIAFDNKIDFDKFVKNINILMCIQAFHPKSIYELARIIGIDQSNLNKIVIFFETIGAIKIEEKKINNRIVKQPIVDYNTIEFNLMAA